MKKVFFLIVLSFAGTYASSLNIYAKQLEYSHSFNNFHLTPGLSFYLIENFDRRNDQDGLSLSLRGSFKFFDSYNTSFLLGAQFTTDVINDGFSTIEIPNLEIKANLNEFIGLSAMVYPVQFVDVFDNNRLEISTTNISLGIHFLL